MSSNSLLTLVDVALHMKPIGASDSDSEPSSSSSSHDEQLAIVSDDDSSEVAARAPASTAAPATNKVDCTANNKKKRYTPLPCTLMSLLLDPANEDVLTFLPDGRSFTIARPNVFAADRTGLMHRHFKLTRLDTFVRKLDRWGFIRVGGGDEARGGGGMTFFHPMFRRAEWQLCRKIKRQRNTTTTTTTTTTPASERPAATATATEARVVTPAATAVHQPLVRSVSAPSPASSSASRSPAPPAACQPHYPSPSPSMSRINLLRSRSLLLGARRQQQQRTTVRAATAMSQREVDAATRSVVGAALEALRRDRRLNGTGSVGHGMMPSCGLQQTFQSCPSSLPMTRFPLTAMMKGGVPMFM